jgi:hypothetical protein
MGFAVIAIIILLIFGLRKAFDSSSVDKKIKIFKKLAEQYDTTPEHNNCITGVNRSTKFRFVYNIEKEVDTVTVIINYKLDSSVMFRIGLEDVFSKLSKTVGINDILTGDKEFDDIFLLASSNTAYLIGLLEKDVRDLIFFLADNLKSFKLNASVLRFKFSWYEVDDVIERGFIDAGFSIIDKYQDKGIKDKLLYNSSNDSVPETAAINLIYLITNYPDDLEVKKFLNSYGETDQHKFILMHLQHENFAVKVASIDALSSVGTLADIEILFNLKKNSTNPSLIRTCENTIAAIQSKYGKKEDGLLSLSESNEKEGALSIEYESGGLKTPE